MLTLSQCHKALLRMNIIRNWFALQWTRIRQEKLFRPMSIFFYPNRYDLSVQNDLVLLHSRMVVHNGARKQIIQMLHSSHQGVEAIKRQARLIFLWHGMADDITRAAAACEKCAQRAPSHPNEPLISEPIPQQPFSTVVADLFQSVVSFFWPLLMQLQGGQRYSNGIRCQYQNKSSGLLNHPLSVWVYRRKF